LLVVFDKISAKPEILDAEIILTRLAPFIETYDIVDTGECKSSSLYYILDEVGMRYIDLQLK